jgi:hypothetical protein
MIHGKLLILMLSHLLSLEPEIIGFFVPPDDRTVLISNFSSKTSEEELYHSISQYGPVYKCMLFNHFNLANFQ